MKKTIAVIAWLAFVSACENEDNKSNIESVNDSVNNTVTDSSSDSTVDSATESNAKAGDIKAKAALASDFNSSAPGTVGAQTYVWHSIP